MDARPTVALRPPVGLTMFYDEAPQPDPNADMATQRGGLLHGCPLSGSAPWLESGCGRSRPTAEEEPDMTRVHRLPRIPAVHVLGVVQLTLGLKCDLVVLPGAAPSPEPVAARLRRVA